MVHPENLARSLSILLHRNRRAEDAARHLVLEVKQKELCCVCESSLCQTENPVLTPGQRLLFHDLVSPQDDLSPTLDTYRKMSSTWMCDICLSSIQQVEMVKSEIALLEKKVERIIAQLKSVINKRLQSKDTPIFENTTSSGEEDFDSARPSTSISEEDVLSSSPMVENDYEYEDVIPTVPNSSLDEIDEADDSVEDIKPIVFEYSQAADDEDILCGDADDPLFPSSEIEQDKVPLEVSHSADQVQNHSTVRKPRDSKIRAEKRMSSMINNNNVEIDEVSKDPDFNESSDFNDSEGDSGTKSEADDYIVTNDKSEQPQPVSETASTMTKKKRIKPRRGIHVCKECGKECSDMRSLGQHMLTHIKERSERRTYSCDICQKLFLNAGSVRHHTKWIHENFRPHLCELCGKGFYDVRHLKRHTRSKHNPEYEKTQAEKRFICPTCGERYASVRSLSSHRRLVCDYAHRIKCSNQNCKQRFSTEANLQEHLKHFHKGNEEDKPRCSTCNEEFSSIHMKLAHERRIHEKAFTCKFCQKSSFKDKSMLDSHERTHTGERPFLCTQCGENFRQLCSLTVHLEISSCNPDQVAADKIRKLRSKKQMEWRAKKKASQFKCEVCLTTFLLKERLLLHMSRFHPDKVVGNGESSVINDGNPAII